MSQPAYKICPRCQQPADLYAPQCSNCGHAFRTQFPQPQPQGLAPSAPPAVRRHAWLRNLLIAAAAVLVLVLGVGLWQQLGQRQDLATVRSLAYQELSRSRPAAGPPERAFRLEVVFDAPNQATARYYRAYALGYDLQATGTMILARTDRGWRIVKHQDRSGNDLSGAPLPLQ